MSDYFDDHRPDVGMAALLLEMHGDIKVIKSQTGTQQEQLKDHEQRIRKSERFRYAWPSAATLAALAACITAGVSFIHFT